MRIGIVQWALNCLPLNYFEQNSAYGRQFKKVFSLFGWYVGKIVSFYSVSLLAIVDYKIVYF